MDKKSYPKTCAYCNKDFLGYRENSKYCSDTCKYAWQMRNLSEKAKKRRQEYHKKWTSENWKRRRDYMISYTYGLSPEQYEELLVKQQYSCSICGRHETEFSRKLAVDHDHVTGEIFGLLCQQCNHTLLGKFRSPGIFAKAAEYLKEGTGWFVPKRTKNRKKKKRARRLRIRKPKVS